MINNFGPSPLTRNLRRLRVFTLSLTLIANFMCRGNVLVIIRIQPLTKQNRERRSVVKVVSHRVGLVIHVLRDVTPAQAANPGHVLSEELDYPTPSASRTARRYSRSRHNCSSQGTFHPKRTCPNIQTQNTAKVLRNGRTVAVRVGVPFLTEWISNMRKSNPHATQFSGSVTRKLEEVRFSGPPLFREV